MSAHADEWRDPLEPAVPGKHEHGRAGGRIVPGWSCRICRGTLAEVPTSGEPFAVCLKCDGLA